MHNEHLNDPSGRLARWILHLSQFDFEVEHRRGSDIPHADALSRDSTGPAASEDCVEGVRVRNLRDASLHRTGGEPVAAESRAGVEAAAMAATAASRAAPATGVRVQSTAGGQAARAGQRATQAAGTSRASVSPTPTQVAPPSASSAVSARLLRDETTADPVLSQVMRHLRGEDVATHSADPELQFYLNQSECLYVEDGVLKRRTADNRVPQIVVPRAVRHRVLKLAHGVPTSAHFGGREDAKEKNAKLLLV